MDFMVIMAEDFYTFNTIESAMKFFQEKTKEIEEWCVSERIDFDQFYDWPELYARIA